MAHYSIYTLNTQGAALGYVLLPLRGVLLANFAPSYD